jgi:thymidylate synthase (FAD)
MDKSQVDRINLDGELGIVNSARISYNVWSKTLTEKDKNLIRFLKEHQHGSPFYHPQKMFFIKDFDIRQFDKLDSAGLEWYVAEGRTLYIVRASYFTYCKYKEYFDKYHTLEYEKVCNEEWLLTRDNLYKASRIPYLSFRIKAPIFVVRQLEKHSIGFARNEVSGRYVKFDCEFFEPDKWRKQSKDDKQGSLQDEFVMEELFKITSYNVVDGNVIKNQGKQYLGYNDILQFIESWYSINKENEMCGEQARILLPLATYTHFVWTGSLQDYARLCYFRLKSDAQLETREVVEKIYKLCKAEYPKTFDRLIELVGDRMNKSFKNL